MNFALRLKKLQERLKNPVLLGSIDDFSSNLFYYTGIEDSALVLITREKAFSFSSTQVDFCENYSLRDFKKNFFALLKKNRVERLGVDERSNAARLVFKLLEKKVKLMPAYANLYEQREVKDSSELALMKKAQKITRGLVSSCFEKSLGKTENFFAGVLEQKARFTGFSLNSFPPIIAVDANAAIPHHKPSKTMIKKDSLLLVDCGVKVNNYCADYSTTFYSGKEFKDAVSAVKESMKSTLRKARPGVKGSALTKHALSVLSEYGFQKNTFKDAGLSLGHQVGLDVHEGVARFDKLVLRKGMTITIEPGLYVPGKYGARFEEICFVN
ncbi:MAG: Xaa-Pro peptidase family protein [Candidatus Micrarchaeota archaeon]